MLQVRRTYVDYRLSIAYVGTVLRSLAVAPLVPVLVALWYGEDPLPFLATTAVMLTAGLLLEQIDAEGDLGTREGILLVSLAWLVVPLAGTVPYLVAGTGTLADPVNALFESMSGFTTTGATVMGDISISKYGHAMMLWRQLTQWIGGMGILVLMVAILPKLSMGGAQVINQEAPGLSLQKLTPRIRQTARALWGIYVVFTVLAVLGYYALGATGLAPNMDLYNAVAHALTTLPTGGFSPEGRSMEAFTPAVQWLAMPFMLLAGTNFALFWYVLVGNPRRLTQNSELRAYLLAVLVLGALVTGMLYSGLGIAETPMQVTAITGNIEDSLRQGLFQVIAIVTTTGYASMDVNQWDVSAQTILLFAYFLGGSAGSAAGSIKIVRWVLVKRAIGRSLVTAARPDTVATVRFEGEAVDEETIQDVLVFVLLFIGLFAISTVLLFLDSYRVPDLHLSALEAMSIAMATLGNVGPGFGVVGPMNNFLPFSDLSKFYMIFLMWVGRLEILSVLVIFTPSFWQR